MKALSPIFVFLTLYLLLSIITGDFYKVPITVAFLAASVWAIATTRSVPLDERINIFSRGAGNPGMLLMIWIFVLAGAFASSAKEMGAVEQTVNLTLNILPPGMLLAGIFAAACFVSLSVGTSVGTIVALTPIATGIAQQTSTTLPLIVAAVVGGALFGDNLSFISDTTITATRSQGCRLSDKFRVNIRIVSPAAIICLILYIIIGMGAATTHTAPPVEWLKVIPYATVLIAAVAGANVMLVLLTGILLTGAIGIADGSYDLFGWFAAMSNGILGMAELILITMMAGGMVGLIRHNGGMDWLIDRLTRRVKTRRGAELSIASMVMAADLCTANNTVAIITVGGLAHDIARRFGVDSRKSASLLDTFSCLAQGIIPYGAQLLMAASLASISPLEIMPYLFYPLLMGASALICIIFRLPREFS
ncbi:MAG: Na+/H+ antiporter NhaC family protein [Bacteroidaceae bacterium]|nr:Na+/H+ antiporter NhaC family protein [Bacteroidaceae bacterium]